MTQRLLLQSVATLASPSPSQRAAPCLSLPSRPRLLKGQYLVSLSFFCLSLSRSLSLSLSLFIKARHLVSPSPSQRTASTLSRFRLALAFSKDGTFAPVSLSPSQRTAPSLPSRSHLLKGQTSSRFRFLVSLSLSRRAALCPPRLALAFSKDSLLSRSRLFSKGQHYVSLRFSKDCTLSRSRFLQGQHLVQLSSFFKGRHLGCLVPLSLSLSRRPLVCLVSFSLSQSALPPSFVSLFS